MSLPNSRDLRDLLTLSLPDAKSVDGLQRKETSAIVAPKHKRAFVTARPIVLRQGAFESKIPSGLKIA